MFQQSPEGTAKMLSEKTKILIVDDDIHMLEIMKEMLASEDYNITTAENGKTALQKFNEHKPDLVLLDIMLPDIDGYSICKHIKKVSNIPVIMVTAKIEAAEEIEGLYVGADDYITKPFKESILIARIQAMLRRNPGDTHSIIFKSGNIKIDFFKQTVQIEDRQIDLTGTEFKIFAFLMVHREKIVSPSELLKEIWEEENNDTSHLLQVNISRLRKKLNDNFKEFDYIETVSGQGYILHVDPIRRNYPLLFK